MWISLGSRVSTLQAQLAHEDFERVLVDLAVEAPDRFENGVAADGAAGVAHQQFEERYSRGVRVEDFAGAGDAVAGRVEIDVGDFEVHGAGDGPAAADGAQAGEQDVDGEGLGEIVVGAGVEAGRRCRRRRRAR